ncbi:hypothetical protein FB471_4520 [Amycolatopsis cihanbeyliensis]|uniref:Uncharacterized protein n=1 Tax=Amycolatopsis cihanbeyliensis TaxID=1128664 RepID=A0A542DNN3_AMYCI|nr:hypothetical protein FB471_4520 [Amycolatopsis cihanbeyliensis]
MKQKLFPGSGIRLTPEVTDVPITSDDPIPPVKPVRQ